MSVSDDKTSNLLFAVPTARLLELLRRAHAGEDPDVLVFEAYANAAEHHDSVRGLVESYERNRE